MSKTEAQKLEDEINDHGTALTRFDEVTDKAFQLYLTVHRPRGVQTPKSWLGDQENLFGDCVAAAGAFVGFRERIKDHLERNLISKSKEFEVQLEAMKKDRDA